MILITELCACVTNSNEIVYFCDRWFAVWLPGNQLNAQVNLCWVPGSSHTYTSNNGFQTPLKQFSSPSVQLCSLASVSVRLILCCFSTLMALDKIFFFFQMILGEVRLYCSYPTCWNVIQNKIEIDFPVCRLSLQFIVRGSVEKPQYFNVVNQTRTIKFQLFTSVLCPV